VQVDVKVLECANLFLIIKESQIQMNNLETYFSKERKWKTFSLFFSLVCVGVTFLSIFLIFFEEDLLRIFSPLLGFFPLLITFAIYLFLVFFSLLYIPFQIKKISWRVFLPLAINLATLLIVYYLYKPLTNLRVDIGFLIRENRFNKASQWITQSVQNGSLVIEEGNEETVFLPTEYRNLSDNGHVYVAKENGAISIFFFRGGGMFEYYPGYMYNSKNVSPPIEDGDIVCIRKIKPNWYECH